MQFILQFHKVIDFSYQKCKHSESGKPVCISWVLTNKVSLLYKTLQYYWNRVQLIVKHHQATNMKFLVSIQIYNIHPCHYFFLRFKQLLTKLLFKLYFLLKPKITSHHYFCMVIKGSVKLIHRQSHSLYPSPN